MPKAVEGPIALFAMDVEGSAARDGNAVNSNASMNARKPFGDMIDAENLPLA